MPKRKQRDEEYEPDVEEEASVTSSPEEAKPKRQKKMPTIKKGKPKAKAKPRMKRETKAQRGDRMALFDRIEGLEPRNDIRSLTSWDIGETYMAAIRFSVDDREMTHARNVNLKWDRERPTIRCETDTLNKFIEDNPQIMDTDMWVLEEQFDDGERLRGSMGRVVKKSEELPSEDKKVVRVDVPKADWEELKKAVAENVYKGPAMPVLETSVRTQGLARGKKILSILPRHVKKFYNLPISGHDANKVLSEELVWPLLNDSENKIVEDANALRERENDEHDEKRQNRVHDFHEAWLQAAFAVSSWTRSDIINEREVKYVPGLENRTGFVFD